MRLIRLLKNDLAREVSTWLDKGIVTQEQATAICAEYGIDFERGADYSSGYRLLVNLAYLFIGLAVITVIGANWEQIPRAIRMAGLMISTGVCHLLAIRLYSKGHDGASTGLFLLANILFGASIILIAQIYHLGEHMPDGILLWALGSLPVGLLTKNPLLTLFSCVLGIIWFWVEFGMGYYPWLFPVFIIAGLWVLYVGRTSLLLFLTIVVSTGLWIESLVTQSTGRLDIDKEHWVVASALALFAYALSYWMAAQNSVKSADYAAVLSIWSLRLGLLIMFIMSFSQPWQELLRGGWDYLDSMLIIVTLLMTATLWLGWRTGRLRLFLVIVFIATAVLACVLFYPGQLSETYLQIFCNLCLIATGIMLIIRGTSSGTSHYFFLGIATILATAFLRYLDLIGDYIGGALLFAVIPAVLLGSARYWRHRQRKIRLADDPATVSHADQGQQP